MSRGDLREAFRHAHTLKGVAQNLSLTSLAEAASVLTEALRAGGTPNKDIEALLATLTRKQEQVEEAIHAFLHR